MTHCSARLPLKTGFIDKVGMSPDIGRSSALQQIEPSVALETCDIIVLVFGIINLTKFQKINKKMM